MNTLKNRKGTIAISCEAIDDLPEGVQAVLSGGIVVRAEMMYMHNAIFYNMLHPDFREVAEGEAVPQYEAVIEADSGEYIGFKFVERGCA